MFLRSTSKKKIIDTDTDPGKDNSYPDRSGLDHNSFYYTSIPEKSLYPSACFTLSLVSKMLGHVKLETTQIYTRLAAVDLKKHHPLA